MQPKYSENTILKICYAVATVIIAAITGIAFCTVKVINKITQ